MTIVSYATLQTAIAGWLHRSDLTANIPEFIQYAENRIYRGLRIRCMETAINSTIAAGVVALPARYRQLKHAYIDGSPIRKLDRKDAEWIYQTYPTRSADGKPRFIAREGENFIFGPYPDSNYTLKGSCYAALPPLSDTNTTNWLIDNAPDLLLAAAMCEAQPFVMNDERTPVWDTKYTAAAARLQREDDNEEFSGSPLSSTTR